MAGPWFRMKSLNYTDVADVELASAELIGKSQLLAFLQQVCLNTWLEFWCSSTLVILL